LDLDRKIEDLMEEAFYDLLIKLGRQAATGTSTSRRLRMAKSRTSCSRSTSASI